MHTDNSHLMVASVLVNWCLDLGGMVRQAMF